MLTFKATYQGSGDIIASANPATGETIGEVRSFTESEAQQAVQRARAAQISWEQSGLKHRITVLREVQHLLVNRAEEFCELISKENGKPVQEALETEVLPIVDLLSYFLGKAPRILADKKIPLRLVKYRRSVINYRPRGVVFVISPWNFPFTIPTGTILMSLIAGNTVLHKPASLTPLIALKTQELFVDAGLHPDLYQVLPTSGSMASRIIEMGVDYVNFTGSTKVGLQVNRRCAELMIPSSMELGGTDPLIVCDDADPELAAGGIVWGGLANVGQVCASVERAYIQKPLYEDVLSRVVSKVSALRVGDPSEEDVDVGPMVDASQLDIVEAQVNDALAKGAKALCGGKRIDRPGNFFEPTVLVDVTEDMDVLKDETFGPVIPILDYASDEEVIEKANDSIYGLNAYVFSANRDRAQRIARRIEAGTVMINDVLITHGCPETPWQGCKMSGTGRVHSDQGLRDLCYPYHINEDNAFQPGDNKFWYPYSESKYRVMLAGLRTLFGRGVAGRWEGIKDMFGKS